MQKDRLKTLELILEEALSFNADNPDWMFCLLTQDLTEEEKLRKEEYSKKILKAVRKNSAFKDKDVIKYLSGLPLSHLIGYEDDSGK